MSNYSKTTDFEAKDSLPTGDSGKIIRGAEFETEFDAISTAIATKADTAGPTFTGTLTFETISDGTIGVTAFVDEDDMSSDSATLVPTQQSVKAYVDAVTTELQAQDLDFQADSGGALSIDLDSETLTFTGGTGVDTSGSGNAVTFAIDSTVATLTGTQTLTNKTLTSPDVNTPDIDGGTIDGTVIGGTTPAAVSATTVSATGNITVGGTVDGRDVATDGTKLDGIESGATADQTAAEIRTLVESATDSNVFTDADHTKLDGIEANATADQTDAEIRAAVEAATDSNVFTDADHSKLDGIEAGADVTDTTNVTAAGALMDSELTNLTAVKSLDQGVATTDSPTFAGLTTTANVSFGDNDKAIFGAGSDLQIYHDGSHSYVKDAGTGILYVQGSGQVRVGGADGTTGVEVNEGGDVKLRYNNANKLATTSTGIDVTGVITTDGMTTSADINFGDNDKAIFGAGSDLQIYHDGTHSYVDDSSGTGRLILKTDYLEVQNAAGNEAILGGIQDGAVSLFYDGNTKLATTSTGIDVTGSVTADGATIEGNASVFTLKNTDTGVTTDQVLSRIDFEQTDVGDPGVTARISHVSNGNNGAGMLEFFTGSTVATLRERLKIADSGDISFYEDTGTTAKFFWDSSAESLGIGATSPTAKLDVRDSISIDTNGNTGFLRFNAYGTEVGRIRTPYNSATTSYDTLAINVETGNRVVFTENNNSKVTFSSGQVGIGTDSPQRQLHVSATANNTHIAIERDGADNPSALILGANQNKTEIISSAAEESTSGVPLTFLTGNTEAMRIDSSGNVGISTNNPSSTLDVAGNVALANYSGTGENQTILAQNDYGQMRAGIRSGVPYVGSISALDFALYTGNSEKVRIETSGNVGIGTSSPNSYTGYTALTLNNATNGGLIDVESNGTRVSTFFGTASQTNFGTVTATPLVLLTNNTEAMRIDSSGDVIIGSTVAPVGAGLAVNSGISSSSTYAIEIQQNTTGAVKAAAAFGVAIQNGGEATNAADLYFATASGGSLGERMRITSGGALEIGPTGNKVIIKSQASFQNTTLESHIINANGLGAYGSGDLLIQPRCSSVSSNNIVFGTSGGTNTTSERMRLDTSGNLLVGTTDSTPNGLSISGAIVAFNDGTRYAISLATNTSATSTAAAISNTNGLVGTITTSGSSTAYNTSSDQRLKDNIVDAPSASDDIDAIQVRSFDWKANGSHQKYGMVAQELQAVAPEAVSAPEDPDEMMGVDYSKLVPMLVKEIQSLRARVAQLEGAN